MPTVKATSTFGQSKWAGHAEVSQAIYDWLASQGFLWVMQRTPSSNAEKVIEGYEKRPDGFKRSSIAWVKLESQLAKLLAKPIDLETDDEVKFQIIPVIDSVKYHEIGAGAEPKYADEKKAVKKHIDAKDIVTWATDKVGYTGGGDLDENNVEFLKAVKALKQRLLAEGM